MSESTAPSTGSSTSKPSTAQADGDWTDQVTELIVDSVDKVRSHTTGPILQFSKGMVYAIVALVVALPIVVLFLIGLVRVFTIFLPAWATYLLFGIIFVLVGVVLWSKRGRIPT